MVKVAITGGLGSGKSTVLAILKEKGFAVVDADTLVSELYKRDEIRGEVKAVFGSVDRGEIARQAFSDPGKRRRLEAILHPPALSALCSWFQSVKGKSFVFAEVPLLYEAGIEREFDFVVAISAGIEARLGRLKAKGMSGTEALMRMDAQLGDEERVKKADFVIDNSGSAEQLEKQVELLLKELGGLSA